MLHIFKENLIQAYAKRSAGDVFADTDVSSSQYQQLRKLLIENQGCDFGKAYGFSDIAQLPDAQMVAAYQQTVPIVNYEQIYQKWWSRVVAGAQNVVCTDRVRHIAHSSGTTAGSRKYIPVSDNMIRTTKQSSKALIHHISEMPIPKGTIGRHILSIGGSVRLTEEHGLKHGLFSGIVFGNTPWYWEWFYKPGRSVHALSDWNEKVRRMVQDAPSWDIGAMYGFPCWITPLLEEIVQVHRLSDIREIWPNLALYCYSGMRLDPYRSKLESLIGDGVMRMESYVASEGYFAIQQKPNIPGMRLITDNSIYYEFIPFDVEHFDDFGEALPTARAIPLSAVELNKDYALAVTNNSGAWRYLLGDVVRFVHLDPPQLVFSGRTAHYINDCSERLSMGNLETAFTRTMLQLGINCTDFAVQSEPQGGHFQHIWYVEANVIPTDLATALDKALDVTNANYTRMRGYGVILPPIVRRVEPGGFHAFLKQSGQANGQSKIPRVLKGSTAQRWQIWYQQQQ